MRHKVPEKAGEGRGGEGSVYFGMAAVAWKEARLFCARAEF